MRLLILAVCLTSFLYSNANPAADFSNSWQIRALARSDEPQQILRARNGTILKRVDTHQMRYIYAVKSSIADVSETEATLILVNGNQPNAFAGKVNGNHNVIGINMGMLDLLGMDMHAMAAVLGHEFAHLRLHHRDSRIKRTFGFALLKILGAATLQQLGVPSANSLSNLTFSMIDTKYSRDDEREADYLGMIWAVEAGYEAEGGVRLHEALYKASKVHPLPFLSDHPSGPERIITLKRLAKRLGR